MTDLSAKANSTAPLFHHRPFRLLFITRTAANTANQMQAVAVGWLIYDLTGSALALGLIGLVQFLPPLALSLIAGQVVDHYSRRLILVCCYIVEFIVSVALLALAVFADRPVELIFVLLLINAVALSRTTITRHGGHIMFAAVAVYGLATIAFGFSSNASLSLAMLMIVGAADMLSTVIRQSLIQFSTPDDMRGRVFAVNALFVNTSSQIGMFESGVTAEWFGAVGSAVLGGGAVLAIVVLWAWRFPRLRNVERPDQLVPDQL